MQSSDCNYRGATDKQIFNLMAAGSSPARSAFLDFFSFFWVGVNGCALVIGARRCVARGAARVEVFLDSLCALHSERWFLAVRRFFFATKTGGVTLTVATDQQRSAKCT